MGNIWPIVGDRVRVHGNRREVLNGKAGTIVDGMTGIRTGDILTIILQFACVEMDDPALRTGSIARYIVNPDNLEVLGRAVCTEEETT